MFEYEGLYFANNLNEKKNTFMLKIIIICHRNIIKKISSTTNKKVSDGTWLVFVVYFGLILRVMKLLVINHNGLSCKYYINSSK